MNQLPQKLKNLTGLLAVILYTLGVFMVAGGLARSSFEKTAEKQHKEVKSILESQLKRERDKLNAETVSRQALELERDELRWMIADSGSKISQLQQLVKRAGSKVQHATVASTQTTINASAPSEISLITPADSNQCPEIAYSAEIKSLWYSGHVFADKDSIRIDNLIVRNDFEVWQRHERVGLFKPLQPVVYFKSLNPHTTVTDIQSYAVKPKSQPKVVRILQGVVIGLAVYGAADVASNFLR